MAERSGNSRGVIPSSGIFSNVMDPLSGRQDVLISPSTSRYAEERIFTGLGHLLDAVLSGSPGLYDSGLTYLYQCPYVSVLYRFFLMFQELYSKVSNKVELEVQ